MRFRWRPSISNRTRARFLQRFEIATIPILRFGRLRLRWLFEHGAVANLVERPIQENTGRTVLGHCPLGEGKWGRKKCRSIPRSVRETGRDESQSVPHQKNSSKQGIWSSPFLRDLSQVVRRTPQDTPVPLHTRTSPWPRSPTPNLAPLASSPCLAQNSVAFE